MKESYDKRLKSCLIVLASNVFRGRNTQVRVALIPMRKELMLLASRNNIKIRLNDDELSLLNDRVIKSGYSRERYIRSLISGIVPKEKPPLEYHKLINEFNHIGVNLNQLVRQLYQQPILETDVRTVLNQLEDMIKNLDKQVRTPIK